MLKLKTKKIAAFVVSAFMTVSILGTAIVEANPHERRVPDRGPNWQQHDSNWQNDHDRQWREHEQEWQDHDREWREHANDKHWQKVHAHEWNEWYKWHHDNGDDGFNSFIIGVIAGIMVAH